MHIQLSLSIHFYLFTSGGEVWGGVSPPQKKNQILELQVVHFGAFWALYLRFMRIILIALIYSKSSFNVGQHYHYTAQGWCVRLLFEACALHGYA